MNLRDLLDVKAICDTGSFRKAAAIRGVTQPTLSNRIAHLESQLGATLFDRSKGRSSPTDLARFIASRAAAISARGEVLLREINRVARARDGLVRLGIGAGLGQMLIESIVTRTASVIPAVGLEFHSGSTQQLTERLLEKTIDIAVCAAIEPANKDLEAVQRVQVRNLVVANPAHPMFDGPAPEIRDLFEYPIALPFTEPRYHALVEEHYGVKLSELPGRVFCTGYEAILRLLRSSRQHFSAGPEFAFRAEMDSGRLRALDRELPFRHVVILYVNRTAYPFPAVAEVLAILRQVFEKLARA